MGWGGVGWGGVGWGGVGWGGVGWGGVGWGGVGWGGVGWGGVGWGGVGWGGVGWVGGRACLGRGESCLYTRQVCAVRGVIQTSSVQRTCEDAGFQRARTLDCPCKRYSVDSKQAKHTFERSQG